MSDCTPTTDEVRLEYMAVRWAHNETVSFEARAQFDRWLASVERSAAEKAYERGRLDERHDCNITSLYHGSVISAEQLQRDLRSRNPYRREETE